MNFAAFGHGKGPKSTPAFYNGKLYTLGISGILSCFDAATGALKWRKEFSKQFNETSPAFGVSMSPVIDNGLCIMHAGGPNQGALTAFEAETGNVKWSWQGDNAAILHDGDFLFLLNDEADLVVARASARSYEPVANYTIADSETWAHPVVIGNQILVKDKSTLALWSIE